MHEVGVIRRVNFADDMYLLTSSNFGRMLYFFHIYL